MTPYQKRKKIAYAPGDSPGMIKLPDDALSPVITLYIYNKENFQRLEIQSFEELKPQLSDPGNTYWIDIKGLGDINLIEALEGHFGINNLEMEDVIHPFQRPKMEEYDTHVFIVSRMLYINQDACLINEQHAMFVFNNTVITFQESYTESLAPVKERIKSGKGNMRTSGPMYLAYAILDNLLDNYFPILEMLGDKLEATEDLLYSKPEKQLMFGIQDVKRDLIVMRRAVWPERDKLNDILRSDSPIITAQAKTYLKDSYDHCVQVMDMVESYKEIAWSLMDLYLSTVSNKMNEVMKVLTVISSIFIPLTFIAGVYGMNFSRTDPETGKILWWNMPELYSPSGYVIVMAIMFMIAAVQVVIFWRKGWLK